MEEFAKVLLVVDLLVPLVLLVPLDGEMYEGPVDLENSQEVSHNGKELSVRSPLGLFLESARSSSAFSCSSS